ncbi:MAG: SCO family protein [Gammaproteobacteria bacterium]
MSKNRAATHRQPIMLWMAALVAALALSATGESGWACATGAKPSRYPPSTVFSSPSPALADFILIDQDGAPFTRAELQGRWTFLYFGYMFCPDACPLTLAELAKTRRKLMAQGVDGDIAYRFVSVDPARDTPAGLKQYVASFDPRFGAATGARGEIDRLTAQLGVYYQINKPEENKDYYFVDHSSSVILINPDARLQAVLNPPHGPQQLAEDFLKIRDYYLRQGSSP